MSDEKNEKPTHKKIEDAREKGQVAQSKDLARVAMLAAVAELAFGAEPLWRGAIHSLMALSISSVGKPFVPAMAEMFGAVGLLLLLVFGTMFVVCWVVGIAAHWGQFGVLIAPESLTPKLDKLDPVNGFKQLVSKKKLGELLLTVAKALLIGFVIYALTRDELPNIVQLAGGEPKDIYFGFITILRSIFHVILGLCLCIAVIDFVMQKHFHIKSLMMDMQDIKREFRESEGDPMVKWTRKQLARKLAMEGPADKTENADALVVNPTHFAVAMRYDPAATPVPVVLAKGKDEIAQAMIQRAKERGIPVIRHVWLARTLYATCRPDSAVPRSSYEAVAHVYAVVQELRDTDRLHHTVELENYGEPPETFNG